MEADRWINLSVYTPEQYVKIYALWEEVDQLLQQLLTLKPHEPLQKSQFQRCSQSSSDHDSSSDALLHPFSDSPYSNSSN
jgi:hypothetical protein